MSKQMNLAGMAPSRTRKKANLARPVPSPSLPPQSAGEIATIERSTYGLAGFFNQMEYPQQSTIVLNRSNGQGLRVYRQMMLTNTDMSALFELLFDDVLHNPAVWRQASTRPEHLEHARFLETAFSRIEHLQNALRHALYSYAYGFTVLEKEYEIIPTGEFAGAVSWKRLRDKPPHWFTFGRNRELRFRTIANYSPGEEMPAGKFIVPTYGTNSDPYGMPVLDYCYWPHIAMHKLFKDQVIYLDKWASPTVWAQFEATGDKASDLDARRKALTVAQAIQGDQSIATPKGMILDLLESKRNGSVSFEQAQAQFFAMISRRITGQLLATTGEKGGSYALARVHAEGKANKVEMLAMYTDSWISREARELIDRNYGAQDAYPRRETLARDPLFKQAHLELEQMMIANGHRVSMSHSDDVIQNVLPTDPTDELVPSATSKPGQVLPINTNLEVDDEGFEGTLKWRKGTLSKARLQLAQRAESVVVEAETVKLASHREVHAQAKQAAGKIRAHLDKIGAAAKATAKPAIKRAVKSIASQFRGKKSPKAVPRAKLIKGLKGYDGAGIGHIFSTMFQRSGGSDQVVSMAAGDAPPDIPDSAKLAYALQMLAIVDSVDRSAADAPEGMDGSTFADSLTDPNGAAVDETHYNLFEGTHSTNIASIATGALREKLASPAFRKSHPYVIVVATNPDARLSHRMMDGFILSAEEARYSPFLPPYGFGCDCQVVPISKETAVAMGLTGAAPAGSLDEYLVGKGATPSRSGGPNSFVSPSGDLFTAGAAPGFSPAFSNTDLQVQLDALRAKAHELAQTEPEAWVELKKWVVWLFGYDVLTQNPPQEDSNAQPN